MPRQAVFTLLYLIEVRAPLNAVYVAAGLSAPVYGEGISAGATLIRASHLMEVRAAIVAVPACSYMLETGTLFVGADATTGAVSVATFGGCEWTASGGGFAPLSSGSGFSGSGIATFAISANASTSARSTTVVVAGQSVVVNQAGVGQSSQNDPTPPTIGEPVDTEVVYFHTDAIGSVRMVTDAAGAVLHRYDYSPDGALLSQEGSGVPWNRRTWAGKERDVETAAGATQPLDYFGARYYAQQVGRFTAVDPVLVVEDALGDPQRWNRYGHGMNNPLRYVDPDGRYSCDADASASDCQGLVAGMHAAWVRAFERVDRGALAGLKAIGWKNDGNGVNVRFEDGKELTGEVGRRPAHPGPVQDLLIRRDDIATLRSEGGSGLLVHEGLHVLQRNAFRDSGNPQFNLAIGDAELNAFLAQAAFYQSPRTYSGDCNGARCSFTFGPGDVNEINRMLLNLDRYRGTLGRRLYGQ